MYQKSATFLLLLYFCITFVGACICTKGVKIEKKLVNILTNSENRTEAFCQNEMEQEVTRFYLEDKTQSEGNNLRLTYELLKKNYCISLNHQDYDTLLHIVEAEAGGEDYKGKLLVANVIINRVNSSKFPNSIQKVVYQRKGNVSQFTPVSDGRINKVIVSKETQTAVEDALLGTDESEGALYFVNRKAADPVRMKWFDEHLKQLFVYGNHEFFF